MTRTLRAAQQAAFVGLGVALSLLGPLLPAVRAELPMSLLQSGLVLSGGFVGMVASAAAGGPLADRFGKLRFLVAASAATAGGLLLFASAHGFAQLLAASVVTGLGNGACSLGVTALQADRAEAEAARAMSLLHFFVGVGAMAGPVVAALALRGGLGWRAPFLAAAALPALVGAAIWRERGPRAAPAAAHRDEVAIARSPGLWACALLLALYVGIETSTYGWAATFWEQRAAGHAFPAPLLASAFWGALTLGRLLCGRLADGLGPRRFLASAAAGAVAVYGAWALWPTPAATLACVPLAGILLAGIYPTTMVLATSAFPGHTGKVVGFLTLASSVGGFAVPAGVGRFADGFGLGALPPLLAGLMLLLLLSLRWARFPRVAPGDLRRR